ncbi:hypothetical protein DSECCO2_639920 [anaerobic digester metagenome]
MLLAMIDVPPFNLDQLHERPSVAVEAPAAAVILDDVPGVHVGLAMFARLDLKGGRFNAIAALRVGEHPNVANDLADLGKLESARDR